MHALNRLFIGCMLIAGSVACQGPLHAPGNTSVVDQPDAHTAAAVLAADPIFTILEAPGGRLNINGMTGPANVQVRSPNMAGGDTLRVYWSGTTPQSTAIQTASGTTPLNFQLPINWLTPDIGRTGYLYYTYTVGGAGQTISSGKLPLSIIRGGAGVDGQRVAAQLNERYSNTSNDCAGQAAYYCNGVLVRVMSATTSYKAWNPSDASIRSGGVSFTYLRKDTGVTQVAWDKAQGIVFKAYTPTPPSGTVSVRLLCSFPTDGDTFSRVANGCGVDGHWPSVSRPCAEQGIDTVNEWQTHYRAVYGPVAYSDRNRHQCGFGPDKSGFELSLAVRAHFEAAAERESINEVVLQTWQKDIPRQLPLEAFFYTSNRNAASGLAGARYIQQDFFHATNTVLPIIRLDITNATQAFSYVEEDQAISPFGNTKSNDPY